MKTTTTENYSTLEEANQACVAKLNQFNLIDGVLVPKQKTVKPKLVNTYFFTYCDETEKYYDLYKVGGDYVVCDNINDKQLFGPDTKTKCINFLKRIAKNNYNNEMKQRNDYNEACNKYLNDIKDVADAKDVKCVTLEDIHGEPDSRLCMIV